MGIPISRWIRRRPSRLPGESCTQCRFWLDHSDADPEEPVGYCGHPLHWTPDSAHFEYRGHWAASDDWCDMFERPPVEPGQTETSAGGNVVELGGGDTFTR